MKRDLTREQLAQPVTVTLPLSAVLVVLNYGRVIWADLGYGIAVGVLGPIAIFRAFARM